MSQTEKRRRFTTEEKTAYHEAGHAVIRISLPGLSRNTKVTIVPKGDALGYTKHRCIPSDHQSHDPLPSPSMMGKRINQIISLLAGGIAEKRLTKRYNSTGAKSDRETAINYACDACGPFGDSELLLQWLWARTSDIVERHWDLIDAVAQALLKDRTLTGDQVGEVMRKAPCPYRSHKA